MQTLLDHEACLTSLVPKSPIALAAVLPLLRMYMSVNSLYYNTVRYVPRPSSRMLKLEV
jgi:hypothetical protein